MYQTASITDKILLFFKKRTALSQLILINIIVWLLVKLGFVIFSLFQTPTLNVLQGPLWEAIVSNYFGVPANVQVLAAHPWTIITYMFLHIGFLHILFNMLWLYWFGLIFREFLNDRQLYSVYFFGGISGAVLFILAFNLFPAFEAVRSMAVALGASASVMAIVVAIAFLVPDYTVGLMFIGNIKIKYIALVFIAMDIAMIPSDNAGGHIAHLGGAVFGMTYILFYKKGLYLQKWLNFLHLPKKRKKTKFTKTFVNERPLTDEEYNIRRVSDQKRTDKILDKIAKSGYSSLTKEEKEFLFRTSKK